MTISDLGLSTAIRFRRTIYLSAESLSCRISNELEYRSTFARTKNVRVTHECHASRLLFQDDVTVTSFTLCSLLIIPSCSLKWLVTPSSNSYHCVLLLYFLSLERLLKTSSQDGDYSSRNIQHINLFVIELVLQIQRFKLLSTMHYLLTIISISHLILCQSYSNQRTHRIPLRMAVETEAPLSVAGRLNRAVSFYSAAIPIFASYKLLDKQFKFQRESLGQKISEEKVEEEFKKLHEWGSEILKKKIEDLKGML